MAEHPLATACVSGFDPAVQRMIRPWNNATSGKSAFFCTHHHHHHHIIILSSIALPSSRPFPAQHMVLSVYSSST